ncbi:MAG: histidine phosphatase family protein [Saprospiraceae bacterium]|nr:histidine phosphatase family protein [Saprospiraceae bacterium]
MKTILISRHAKSAWDNPGLKDFDRPLNTRGHHDAPEMAEKIKQLGIIPDVLISSPANRALTTARYYASLFDMPITEIPNLYHGMPEHYLDSVHELAEDVQTVVLFGHNPGITYIANMIKPGITDNIPTAGVIVAKSRADLWSDVDWELCSLERILTPKEITY